MPTWSVVLAGLAVGLITIFLVFQIRRVLDFYLAHSAECWVALESPDHRSDVDDPALALLGRLCCLRPYSREQGVFVMPEEEVVEPQRTELALAEAFNCGMGFRRRIARRFFHRRVGYYAKHDARSNTAGHKLERLNVWLGEGTATRAGVFFLVVRVFVQMAIAVNTGFLFAHPFSVSVHGQKVQLGLNVGLLVFVGLFSAVGVANDVWNGVLVSLMYLLEAAANACTLASVLRVDELEKEGAAVDALGGHMTNATSVLGESAEEEERLRRLSEALALVVGASHLLMTSVFVPLLLVLYDSFCVPVVLHVWQASPGTAVEVACEVLVALIVVPLQAMKALLGIEAASAGDLMEDYGDTMSETSAATKGSELPMPTLTAVGHARAVCAAADLLMSDGGDTVTETTVAASGAESKEQHVGACTQSTSSDVTCAKQVAGGDSLLADLVNGGGEQLVDNLVEAWKDDGHASTLAQEEESM